MNRAPVLILLSALLGTSPAWAQVHKCTDAGGRVSYSDLPCAAAAPARTAVAPPSASAPAARTPAGGATSAAGAAPSRSSTGPAARATGSEIDPDLAARQAAAAQTADCGAALRQMGVAGAGMRLAEAGHARGAAMARCGGG